MSKIDRFEDFKAWKTARTLTKEICRISKNDLFIRDYSLGDRICRASVSIMSNIAEGFEREGKKDFLTFLSIAKGSSGEVRSQLYVALDQNYITESELKFIRHKTIENSRVISGLIKDLKQSELRGSNVKQHPDSKPKTTRFEF